MFESLLNVLPFRSSTTRPSRTVSGSSRRLEIEALEERCVPATMIRPIEDFVSTQGTFLADDTPDTPGGLFVPPTPNFLGWTDPKDGLGISFDYAGLANATIEELSDGDISLGTSTTGKVIERSLSDGRTEVTVLLHTKNALTWGIAFNTDNPVPFGQNELIFGARPTDVLDGATPALGDSFLHITFITNDPLGSPIPDLLELLAAPEPGQEVTTLKFRGSASGELRDDFGVPDGTPGRVEVVQTGVLHASFQGAVADGFPSENIHYSEAGKGTAKNSGPSSASYEALLFAALDSVLSDKGKGKK